MAFISIENLSCFVSKSNEKDFEPETLKILEDISLEIEKGEYIVVIGSSGAGKTTLLRQLKPELSLTLKKNGNVCFKGRKIEEINPVEVAQKIGFVMQNPELQIVTDKVWHELAFGLENIGFSHSQMQLRVSEMASCFDLQKMFNSDVSVLSEGQKQILNLASVLCMSPEVLVLDEASSQLDPVSVSNFNRIVRSLNKDYGVTVISAAHNLDEVFYDADKIAVLDKGHLVVFDSPENTAKKLFEQKNPLFNALPLAVRFAFECSLYTKKSQKCDCVRDCRKILSDAVLKSEKKVKTLSEFLNKNLSVKGNSVISIKNAWFRYEKNAEDILKELDLEIPKGVIFSIAGGNGAGKSTLLKCICGVKRIYRGKIKISCSEKKIKLVPQNPRLIFACQSVYDELKECSKDDEAVKRICALFNLERLLNTHPYDLSGGEQQRLALAKILITEPEVILLDEPTKGNDCCFKSELSELLEKIKQTETTIVIVSHDLDFCAEVSDYCALMFDGKISSVEVPEKFFSNNHFYTTKANIISRGIFDGVVTSEKLIECAKDVLC